jgi:hypothetical protein
MTLGQLKWFRVLIPGLLIIVLGSQLFTSLDIAAAWTAASSGPYVVLAIVAGALYDALDIRAQILKPQVTAVDGNIKRKLLAMCVEDSELARKTAELKGGRPLMHIFYRLVDNDKTLSEKAKLVYFNGLIWSTAADVVVIGFPFALANVASAFFSTRADHLLAALILSGAVLVADIWLLPAATKHHIQISDEQLDYIKLHHADDLCSQIRKQAALG